MFKGVPTYITSAHAELGLLMTFLELLKRKNSIFYVPRAIDSIAARKKKKKADSTLLFCYPRPSSSRYACGAHLLIYICWPLSNDVLGLWKDKNAIDDGPAAHQSRITWGWFWIENLKRYNTIQPNQTASKEKIIVARHAAGIPTNPRRDHTAWWKQSGISILYCKQGRGNVVPVLDMKNNSTISYVFSSAIIHQMMHHAMRTVYC